MINCLCFPYCNVSVILQFPLPFLSRYQLLSLKTKSDCRPQSKRKRVFFLGFHTGFYNGKKLLCFPKAKLDVLCKDCKHKFTDEDFAVALNFSNGQMVSSIWQALKSCNMLHFVQFIKIHFLVTARKTLFIPSWKTIERTKNSSSCVSVSRIWTRFGLRHDSTSWFHVLVPGVFFAESKSWSPRHSFACRCIWTSAKTMKIMYDVERTKEVCTNKLEWRNAV